MPRCHLELKAAKPLQNAYPCELNSLGDNIWAKRLALALYQKEVAALIGVRECNIWNRENNWCQPAVRFIPKIIDFLGYAPFTPKPSLSEWLKMVRSATGLSQKALARALGMEESTINDWERARHRPAAESLGRIRDLLTATETRKT